MNRKFFISLKKTSFAFFIFCMSISSYADVVSFVYRADSRDPNDVFENGFAPWGRNINFYAHIAGRSTADGTKDSAFIATTADVGIAEDFALERLLSTPDFSYYIYIIRATNNFYSAERTMLHLFNIYNKSMPAYVKKIVKSENEYVALGSISTKQIYCVRILRFNPYTGKTEEFIEYNPNYNEIDTYANLNPYTGSDYYPLNSKPILFIGPPLLSGSFQSDSKESYTKKSWPLTTVLDEL